MNKENIYHLIGYRGEYNKFVKKNLKKLLKEYHPDNGGDTRIFKIINEVKNELENNKTSIDVIKSDTSNSKKIDYDFCVQQITHLEEQRKMVTSDLQNKKSNLSNLIREYNRLYQLIIDKENLILEKKYKDIQLYKIKNIVFINIVLLITLFIISIITNNNIIFAFFAGISIVFLIQIYLAFKKIQFLANNKNIIITDYVKYVREMHDLNHKKNKLMDAINNLKKQLNIIDNDLRFYHNLLK